MNPLNLLLVTNLTPPRKSQWSNGEFEERKGWGEIFEAISNWFCYSNGFRTENSIDLVIIRQKVRVVRFIGNKLRYLSPQLRSAASLVSKGWNKQQTERWTESTPGVIVKDFPSVESYVNEAGFSASRINLESKDSNQLEGRTMLYDPSMLLPVREEYHTPFKYLAQLLIWNLEAD